MSPPGNDSEFANTLRESSMCVSCKKAGVGRNQSSCIGELLIYVKKKAGSTSPFPPKALLCPV